MRNRVIGFLTVSFFGALLLCLFKSTNVYAASFKYKDYQQKKVVTYSGVQPQYEINTVKIDMGSTPAIINENNVAMAPVNTVFRDAIGAKCSYSSSKERLTITYDDKVLVLYMNKKEGTLNGKRVTATAAPFRVKYSATGEFATFVPSRFVAETLGMTYNWDAAKGTVSIKAPVAITYNGETIFFGGKYGKITFNGKKLDAPKTPSIAILDTGMVPIDVIVKADPELKVQYEKSTGTIILKRGNIELQLQTGLTTAFVNGIITHSTLAPGLINLPLFHSEALYVPAKFVFQTLGYKYTWYSSSGSVELATSSSTGKLVRDYEVIKLFTPERKSAYYDENKVKHPYYHEFELPLPVSAEELLITDDFYNNKITFDLKGNRSDFFKTLEIEDIAGNGIEQVQILYYPSKDITTVNLLTKTNKERMILGFKSEPTENGIRFIIDEPKFLFDKILILDAGHGGGDAGATKNGVREKSINYNIANVWCRELFDKTDIKVYYSRPNDVLIDLGERASLGKRLGADLFISIHQNECDVESVKGASVYSGKSHNQTAKNGFTSLMFAQLCQKNLVKATGCKDRGTIQQDFDVTFYNEIPAVLYECGFISNNAERELLASDSYQKKIAKSIYETVISIFDQYDFR